MATSGNLWTEELDGSQFTIGGTTYTIYDAKWGIEWTAAHHANGQTKVTYIVYASKRAESPSDLSSTGATLSITADTGSFVSGGNTGTIEFKRVTRKYCVQNVTSKISQNTGSSDYNNDDGILDATEYSFIMNHTTAGVAKFKVALSCIINGSTRAATDTTFELDNNKPNRTLTLNGGVGTSGYTGAGSHRIGSSVTIDTTVASGYTWSKWTNGSASGTQVSTTKKYTFSMPTSDVTYYANATLNTYSITYSLGGGSWPSDATHPSTYNVTTATFTLGTPQRTGYTFAGWTGTGLSSATKSVSIATGSTGNKSYTANWTANTYEVAYNGNGSTSGSMSNSKHTYDTAKTLTANAYQRKYTVTYNHNYTGSTNASKTATYTFSKWNTKSNGTGTSYNNSASVTNLATSGTVTLYAQWTSASVDYNPTRTGYRFGGWYTTSACTTAVTHPYTPTAAKTFYAKWTANTYTVTYDGNGSTGGSTESSSHTYDSAKTLTANGFTRTGYTFAGWASTSTGSVSYADGQSVTNLTSTHNGTVTLYARWTPITYSIAYNKNGGSGSMSNSTHTYDTEKSLTANAYSRSGYSFSNWNTTSNGTGTSYSDQDSVKNLSSTKDATVTLYAQWSPDTDTVYKVQHWKQKIGAGTTQNTTNFDLADTESKTGTTDSNTSASAKSYTGFTAQTFSQSTISGTGSTVVDIYYYRKYFTLAMMVGTGITSVSPNSADIQYGTTVSASAIVAPGYTWKQWTVSGADAVTSNPYNFEMPARSVTLMAVATANSDTPYKVKHCKQALDGTYPESLQETETLYGTTATDTSAIERKYEGFTSQSFSQAEIKADGSTTITINYTRNSYTVNLTPGIGVKSVTGDGTYKYEESVTVNATMATGYTWSRWSGDKTSTNRSFTFTMPASNVNLTANSTANGYTITYVGQNGKQSVGAPNPGSTSDIEDAVVYNTYVTVRREADAFTRTGYKFLGWATSANSKVVSTTWPAGETKKWERTTDLKLYAIWKSKGVLYVDTGSEFVPYTIWIDSGASTGGPNNDGWYQYTAWLDTGDTSQGTNGWVQLGSLPD